jgi:hypothetical protein
VEKPNSDLPIELIAIIYALAKEQARRDHAAEVEAQREHGRR